jgi:hypothetical protein
MKILSARQPLYRRLLSQEISDTANPEKPAPGAGKTEYRFFFGAGEVKITFSSS